MGKRNSTNNRQRWSLERLETRDTPAFLATPGLPAGTAPDGNSLSVIDVSADGTKLLFTSTANNLAAGVADGNGAEDLFYRDLTTSQTFLVSRTPGGLALGFDNSDGGSAVLSADGNFVAWVSKTNADAVTGDAAQIDLANTPDVFRWSAATKSNVLVSARNSGDGNTLAIGSIVNAISNAPQISADGSKVAFVSNVENNQITSIVLTDDPSTQDVFVRNLNAVNAGGAATTPVTQSSANPTFMIGFSDDVFVQVGSQWMSNDGNRFAFFTKVDSATLIAGTIDQPAVTATLDVFLRDLSRPIATGLELVSVSVTSPINAAGAVIGQEAGNAVISADGSTVVFLSNAQGDPTGLVNDLQLVPNFKANGTGNSLYRRTGFFGTGATTLVNAIEGTTNAAGSNDVLNPGAYLISSDGRVVVFESLASDLVPTVDTNGLTDVYVRDFTPGTPFTDLMSAGTDGFSGGAAAFLSDLSDDGTRVLFQTASANLIVGVVDNNGVDDVFQFDRVFRRTGIVSANPAGRIAGNSASGSGRIAGDGSLIAFSSGATNVDPSSIIGNVTNIFTTSSNLPLPLQLTTTTVASGISSGSTQAYTYNAALNLQTLGAQFEPFTVPGEVRTAVGDIDGDGVEDIIYGVGPGNGSLITVTLSASGTQLSETVYEASFLGGVFLAAGDIDGDGFAEIVISPDQGGGGRIVVLRYNGAGFDRIADFFGIDDPNFRGGARVAVGDVNGDGIQDLVVAAGFGGGPRVALFNGVRVLAGTNGANADKIIPDSFVFEQTLRNGVFVTVGDFNADGFADMAFGGGPGGGPRVLILDSLTILTNGNYDAAINAPLANFFAGNVNSRGGIRLAAKQIDFDNFADLVVASGEGQPGELRTYLGANFPISGQGEPPLQQSQPVFSNLILQAGVYVG
ncbi:beta strand repeat-containing protein [Tuwongella immobilis]|uniref:Uncharacterized protein n=1 Tax=Tuwongella immobilis TaxID=692036 RepID=A0A6C2YW81_9BACT|nr:VCBS repeat-containing protein [Tuwongella immobilis]VIP05651.1 na-ca exchanger integrin-beta4 : Hemolysin-type calcium-binding region domain protein OS=Rhodopirellula maiorica SM1 GN=RMSM_03614 PE=4 SV=1: PD40: VCBS [Tuwongella immobilis]VTS08658.1 na-ca exchanger integrin-beta4 : Hemolysin-type calcium-binding region domain protein OS=Rhodopirellula maiorica SM1 GN=RMSM_03614 PE=4 SV=1: PD40: VCBS [Tuwongella immobilis]